MRPRLERPALSTPEAAGPVLLVIGQDFAVQNVWYPDLDSAAFRAAARELLSRAASPSRLSG